ncbi:hypothetical protein BC939DRAFT_200180 [Gamsiella multidivaricata]|uniref:uncharacterized protein n=1 Tax=Gamsiella multidivaricata TaxID=101098 RepID=UPI00221E991A|nr:uncharacterized protein BC939DRAFT_200180 [Gamsiella multidivaricata]KAI7821926.1 hypothetical protein BC939DRAFT_200180 [Gamsiella multidivaricata]
MRTSVTLGKLACYRRIRQMYSECRFRPGNRLRHRRTRMRQSGQSRRPWKSPRQCQSWIAVAATTTTTTTTTTIITTITIVAITTIEMMTTTMTTTLWDPQPVLLPLPLPGTSPGFPELKEHHKFSMLHSMCFHIVVQNAQLDKNGRNTIYVPPSLSTTENYMKALIFLWKYQWRLSGIL